MTVRVSFSVSPKFGSGFHGLSCLYSCYELLSRKASNRVFHIGYFAELLGCPVACPHGCLYFHCSLLHPNGSCPPTITTPLMDWDITAGATGPTSVFHPYDAHDLPNILDNWPPIQGGNRDDLVFPVPMEFSQWESEFVQDPVPLHVPRTVGPIPPLTRSRRRESQTFPTVLLPGRAPPHRPLRNPRPHPRHHTGSESPQLQHVASRLESRLRRARPRLREALQMADG